RSPSSPFPATARTDSTGRSSGVSTPPRWIASTVTVSTLPGDLPRLFHEREQLEHRQVHRNDDHADHAADGDHHHRLDDRRPRLDRGVDLVLVEVGDLPEHLLQLARLLADLHHLAHHRREDVALDVRLRDRDGLVHLLAHVPERLLDDVVPGRLPRAL